MVPGDSVIDAISGQIYRAASVLIIVSRDSATSRFGRVEWGIALAREAMRMLPTVVALRLDNVEIPGPLAHLNVFDAEGDLEDLVAQLAEALSLVEHHRLAEFDITALQDGGTILTVSADVGARLVERYRDNPEALTIMDRREFEELVAEIFNRFRLHRGAYRPDSRRRPGRHRDPTRSRCREVSDRMQASRSQGVRRGCPGPRITRRQDR